MNIPLAIDTQIPGYRDYMEKGMRLGHSFSSLTQSPSTLYSRSLCEYF